ncbi:MAG TPA: hypothetical protein VI248_25360 [Kineosporiaceae bacterium]
MNPYVAMYLLIVVTVLVLAAAATWPPRPWQTAPILAGPVVLAGTLAGIWPFPHLGWVGNIGVSYAVLVVAPALPWGRPSARLSVPCAVLAGCVALAAAARWNFVVVFYLSLPALLALGALGVALLNRRRPAGNSSSPMTHRELQSEDEERQPGR